MHAAAMTQLIWVALPIAAYIVVLEVPGSTSGSPTWWLYGIGPLILIAAPAAYAIGYVPHPQRPGRRRAALMDLEPGPAPSPVAGCARQGAG